MEYFAGNWKYSTCNLVRKQNVSYRTMPFRLKYFERMNVIDQFFLVAVIHTALPYLFFSIRERCDYSGLVA